MATASPTPVPMQTLLSGSPPGLHITGLDNTQTFTVSDGDAAYVGFYTATTEDATIATVRQGSGASTFIVTSVAAGNTSIDVSTTDGGFLREPVTVTNSGGIVSGKART